MSGGSVVNQWGATTAQDPGDPQPGLLPLGLALDSGSSTGGGSGTPTAGNWLFAVAAWRQDAGSVPTIAFNSTVNIRDDARNFWIPLSVVAPETGIVRTSVWMAPAARAPEYVFASPTGYQSALALSVLEVTADVPWYEVASIASTYTNQGTSVTVSQDPASGLFTVGAIAYDLSTLSPTFGHTGFTEEAQVTASNGIDHTGDLILTPFTGTTTGSSMTLSASGGSADWAEVLVAVHGVTDAIGFPYTLELENWPALICEMACGATLNANWSFDTGIVPWTGQNGAGVAASDLFTFGNSAGSLVLTPSGSDSGQGTISENIQIVAQQPPSSVYTATYTATYEPGGAGTTGPGPVAYDLTAWVNVPAGWSGGVALGVQWYDSTDTFISSTDTVDAVTGALQELTLTADAPANAATAQMFVSLSGAGTPATTNLMYVSYASLAIPGAFGAVPEDQIDWMDLSGRTITQEAIQLSRGIQYEQQSLEAGTMEIVLADNDGYLTAGQQPVAVLSQCGADGRAGPAARHLAPVGHPVRRACSPASPTT